MWNTNDYKTGYEHGVNDARQNKNKNYRFNGLSLKYWINSGNAYKTYVAGYDAGYLDGIRENKIFYQTKGSPEESENKINNTNVPPTKTNPNEVYYCKNCRRQQGIDEGAFCKICGKITVSWNIDFENETDANRRWNNIHGTNNSNQTPIYSNNSNLSTQKTNNMSVQKLQLQLQKLQEMESFLEKLQQQFQQSIKVYNDKMLMLRQSGMPQEVCNTYDQRYQIPKIQEMSKMMQEIQQGDLPYVKKNIAAIQNAIQTAK